MKKTQNDIAFVNVSVIPMDHEGILSNQTVLIQGEKIAAMGQTEQIDLPAGVEIIDGTGKYLMPGLVDMHAHLLDISNLGSPSDGQDMEALAKECTRQLLLLTAATGVTTVRDPGALSDKNLKLREEINRGDLFGPRIFTAAAPMDGNPQLLPMTKPFSSVEEAQQYVRETASKGYDCVKVYSTLPVEIFDAVLDTAAEVGLPVFGHLPMPVDFEHAIKKGMRSIEHLTGYDMAFRPDKDVAPTIENIFMGWVYGTEEKIKELAKITASYKVWNTPTMVNMDVTYTDYERGIADCPYARYMPLPFRMLDDIMYQVFPAENRAALKGSRDVRLTLIKELKKAGAPLLIGTDTPCGGHGVPGFSVHRELEIFVEAGLTPYEALEAGTAEPARFFECEGEFGTIQEGASADLILLEGNPLEDITNTQNRAGVMVRGKWHLDSELQAQLDAMVESFGNMMP